MENNSQNLLSKTDPHSRSRPDLVAVFKTDLILTVNFEEKILKGTAILSVSEKRECDELILDTHSLTITSIRYYKNKETLTYKMENCGKFGDKLTITLPPKPLTHTNDVLDLCEQRVLIDYETTPNSPALYWLTEDQNPTGKFLLIANTKLTFARAIVPCQDTPSHKAEFHMRIDVPEKFTVITSTKRIAPFGLKGDALRPFAFQYLDVPSYELAFVIGIMKKLETTVYKKSFILWAEEEYLIKSNGMLDKLTREMRYAKKEYGLSGRFTICVLPPNVPEFKVQCPNITFVSSTLLDETLLDKTSYSISTIVQNLFESWLGNLITLANFEHLWLIKSFSIYISRKIVRVGLSEHEQLLLKAGDDSNLLHMIELHGNRALVCNLSSSLPYDVIEHTPYEKGFLLLIELEYTLGSENFFNFLRDVVSNPTRVNRTDILVNLVYEYYSNNEEVNLDDIDWKYWLYKELNTDLFVNPYSKIEMYCFVVAGMVLSKWLTTFDQSDIVAELNKYNVIEKMEFLRFLYTSPATLSIDILETLKDAFPENDIRSISNDMWFLWLLLCIKSKWTDMAEPALEFAYQNCTPKYVCAITRDLCKFPETRKAALSWFCDKGQTNYILPETKEKLMEILQVTPEDVKKAIEEKCTRTSPPEGNLEANT